MLTLPSDLSPLTVQKPTLAEVVLNSFRIARAAGSVVALAQGSIIVLNTRRAIVEEELSEVSMR